MKTELHPASERGHASYGWLETYHSFSFATYFNPAREQFGVLRVLNDDTIAGGTGFDLHPRNNMEIITFMLDGSLEHHDSTDTIQVLNRGEVQVMSAGTGISHAEFNHSETEAAKLLQLWIFPRAKGLKPRYDQKSFENMNTGNKLITLVTPDKRQEDDTLWIHQEAYISTIKIDDGFLYEYRLRIPGNGVFTIVIEGNAEVAGNKLGKRDAIGLSETGSFEIIAVSDTKLLFVEVPMK